MTFGELKPGDKFQFSDGKLTGNFYYKIGEIETLSGHKVNTFYDGNPVVFIWVEDNEEINAIHSRN